MTGAVPERQSRRLTTHLMNAATPWIINAVSVDLRHESGVVSGTRGRWREQLFRQVCKHQERA